MKQNNVTRYAGSREFSMHSIGRPQRGANVARLASIVQSDKFS